VSTSGAIPKLIDSHVHLWDPARFRQPWLDGDAVLQRPFGIADFSTASEGLTVEGIVYVQVDVTPAYGLLEARWAARQPVNAIVAWAPLEDGEVARTYLDDVITIDPKIKGVRRLIQSEPDKEFPLRLIEGVKQLPSYGLSFDICIRHDQLAASTELVKACPETQFILDHLGKPPIKAQQLEPWKTQLTALAEHPNVVCKISGAVTEADHQAWQPSDLRPYIEHALESFGEDRVLFGGDWPVVTHAASYRQWVDTLAELSTDDRLWRANAKRVYRL